MVQKVAVRCEFEAGLCHGITVVALLFYVHGKRLRSSRNGQLT